MIDAEIGGAVRGDRGHDLYPFAERRIEEEDRDLLGRGAPEIDLEFVKMEGTFSPALVNRLSEEWKIPKNLMFIGSHGEKFKYDQASLGGVRLII